MIMHRELTKKLWEMNEEMNCNHSQILCASNHASSSHPSLGCIWTVYISDDLCPDISAPKRSG